MPRFPVESMFRRAGHALLVPALLCATGKGVLAQPSDEATPGAATSADVHDRVVELVTQSAEHYEAGRFQRAIDLLSQAFALEASPTIQYNLARAYEGLGDIPRALTAYRLYLELAPEAQDRGAVERRLGVLARQLDEREALEKRATDAESARAEPALAPDPGPGWVPWGVAALGVLFVGAGVAFGVHANALHSEAESADFAADAADTNRSAQTYATLANVSFVTGGALTLAGISWGLLSWPAATPPTTNGGTRVQLQGGMTVFGTF